jgi:hypothetical protein
MPEKTTERAAAAIAREVHVRCGTTARDARGIDRRAVERTGAP